jgi:hypothetical protein
LTTTRFRYEQSSGGGNPQNTLVTEDWILRYPKCMGELAVKCSAIPEAGVEFPGFALVFALGSAGQIVAVLPPGEEQRSAVAPSGCGIPNKGAKR